MLNLLRIVGHPNTVPRGGRALRSREYVYVLGFYHILKSVLFHEASTKLSSSACWPLDGTSAVCTGPLQGPLSLSESAVVL
jgi:hypothetical protein